MAETYVKDSCQKWFQSDRRLLWSETVVFLADGAEFVVRQRDDFVIFDTGHGFGGDHGAESS